MWAEFRDVLIDGVQKKKLICPNSLEHMVESAGLEDRRAIELDALLRKLSDGYSVELELQLIIRQLIGRLRNRNVSDDQVLKRDLLKPMTAEALVQLRQMRAGIFEQNTTAMQSVNEFNSLVGPRKKWGNKQLLDFLIQLRSQRSYLNPLIAELRRLSRTGFSIVTHNTSDRRFADWSSSIVVTLTKNEALTDHDVSQLIELLESEGLAFIPTLKIKASLEAMQFFRSERIEPRDQYDITRAACALPYADFYVTDGGKAAAIRELKLDQEFKTTVYSTKESNLRAAIETISTLASG
ncbi:MAG TPA: hypothetical protein VHE13_01245 [Opitutus sp.]|nr:hypothetical protein [Opitutus sp.]